MNDKKISQRNLNIEKKLIFKESISFFATIGLLLLLINSTYGYEYEDDRIAKEQQQRIIKLKERIGVSYKVIKNDFVSFYDSPNILSERFHITETEIFVIKDWTPSNQYVPDINSYYKIQFESGKIAYVEAEAFSYSIYRDYLTKVYSDKIEKQSYKLDNVEINYSDKDDYIHDDNIRAIKQQIGTQYWIRRNSHMIFYDSPSLSVSESFVINDIQSFVIKDVVESQGSVPPYSYKVEFASGKIAYIGAKTFRSRYLDSVTTENLERYEQEEIKRRQKELEEEETKRWKEEQEQNRKEQEERRRRETRLTKKWGKRVAQAIMKEKVFIGMTKAQVEESWGRPNDIHRSVGRWGVHEQWVYGDFGPYLYFENGRLTSFQD